MEVVSREVVTEAGVVVLEVELDVEVVGNPNAVDRIAETMSGTKPASRSSVAVVATVAVAAGFFGSFVAAGGGGVGVILGVEVKSKNS